MRDALGVYPFVHLGRHGVATKGQHQAARKKHQSHAVTFIGSENGLHYTQRQGRASAPRHSSRLAKRNGRLDLRVPNPNNPRLAVLSRLAASDTGSV